MKRKFNQLDLGGSYISLEQDNGNSQSDITHLSTVSKFIKTNVLKGIDQEI